MRVFLNAALSGSLKAKSDAHPAGSATVKEMFTDAGELRGWAVMVKVAPEAGDDGEGWYWYEVTSATDGSAPVADGTGVGLCVACHDSGTDMVLTAFPLE